MAPDIAIKYWHMPEGHCTMRDLLMYISVTEFEQADDEADICQQSRRRVEVSREVNHTLGNHNQKEDPNPYVSEYHMMS